VEKLKTVINENKIRHHKEDTVIKKRKNWI